MVIINLLFFLGTEIEDPEFSSPIGNVTVPLGREAVLTCAVTNLGNYRVSFITFICLIAILQCKSKVTCSGS